MNFSIAGAEALPLWQNGRALLQMTKDWFDVQSHDGGSILWRVPLCGPDEAKTAVAAAKAAQPAWAEQGMNRRRQSVESLAAALFAYADHFALLLQKESGQSLTATKKEITEAVLALQSGKVGEMGVFALVLGAEQPLLSFARALAPLMLAGATLVVKPSPRRPSAVFALCELTCRCGDDAAWLPGVLNLIHGDTAAINGLCESGVDGVFYSGEAELAEKVATLCAAYHMPFFALNAD